MYDFVNVYSLVEECIDVQCLEQVLEQEMENYVLKIVYEFGVFSEECQVFVIYDGNYVVGDLFVGGLIVVNYLNLEVILYSVILFEDEMGSVVG